MRLVTGLAACVLLLTGCGAASPAASTATSPAASTRSPSMSASVVPSEAAAVSSSPVDASPSTAGSSPAGRRCPNPEIGLGNECLGAVAAGTYTTGLFGPTLTYTVPDGWSNLEDMPGNFLLLPPGAELGGVNTGTSDYLGVYTSVVAPERCTGKYDPNVKRTFEGLLGWLKADPTITLTNVHDVTVGGLDGVVMDIARAKPEGDGCPDGTYADVYVGIDPTSLVHAVDTDYPLRVYLLRNGDKALAVELADAPNGGSDYANWFDAAKPVVDSLKFAGS